MTNPPFVFVPNPESLEKAERELADWIGYAWDGLGDRDISADFPDWAVNGIGHMSMQGGKPALRKIAAKMFTAYMAAEHAAGRARLTIAQETGPLWRNINDPSPEPFPVLILRLPKEPTP